MPVLDDSGPVDRRTTSDPIGGIRRPTAHSFTKRHCKFMATLASPTRPIGRLVLAGSSPVIALAVAALGMRWMLTSSLVVGHAYLALAVAMLALAMSALLLRNAFFPGLAVSNSFVAASGVVLAGWAWQRMAFNLLIPRRFLEYGYFLTEPGKRARHFVLELPGATVAVALTLLLLIAVICAWQQRARWSVVFMVLWWLVLIAVFGLPYLNWSLQGDAAIFI